MTQLSPPRKRKTSLKTSRPAKIIAKPTTSSSASKRQQNWNEMYKRLLKYKSKFGHCNVCTRYADDPQLATCEYSFFTLFLYYFYYILCVLFQHFAFIDDDDLT